MDRTSAGRRRRGAARTRPAPEVAPAPEPLTDELFPLPPDGAIPAPREPAAAPAAGVAAPAAVEAEHEPIMPLAAPEPAFAARVPPPTPEPPLPASRRAIFFDVENTSHPGHIARVIERLAIDRLDRRTEFVAVGNWRVIGHETARLLARRGAQLVHSAPSTGVRDWSDLRIAVSAGVWLAGARPGDVLEIVSDDRAFDAVGDVAAAIGIAFRRLSSRVLADTPEEQTGAVEAASEKRERRARRGPRGGRAARAAGEPRRAETRRHEPGHAVHAVEAHTAPHDELVDIVRELAQRAPAGAVLIDTLERTLKARGFSRPPGSPRLVTRLRRIHELSVSATGMITLVGEPAPAEPVAVAAEAAREPELPTGQPRRRSRRGGRRRRRAGPAGP